MSVAFFVRCLAWKICWVVAELLSQYVFNSWLVLCRLFIFTQTLARTAYTNWVMFCIYFSVVCNKFAKCWIDIKIHVRSIPSVPRLPTILMLIVSFQRIWYPYILHNNFSKFHQKYFGFETIWTRKYEANQGLK